MTIYLVSNTFVSLDLAQYHSDLSQSFNKLACRIRKKLGIILSFFLTHNDLVNGWLFIFWECSRFLTVSLMKDCKSRNPWWILRDVLDSLLNLARGNNSELSLFDIKHVLLVSSYISINSRLIQYFGLHAI